MAVVFVYALVARFPPVKNVLDDVENIFDLAPDAGLALFEFLFVWTLYHKLYWGR